MRILTLRGGNLASLAGSFEVDLTSEPLVNSGLFLIAGDTGSGKSTLLDALCLALYGTYPRVSIGRREDVPDSSDQTISITDPGNILRRGAGRGFAEVDFVANDGVSYKARWEIARARDRAIGRLQKVQRTLTRIEDGTVVENTVRGVEAKIASLTDLTFQQFRRTVLLAQGDFDAFLIADNAERAELLEKITGTEIYAEISQRIFAGTAEQQIEYDRIVAKRESLALLGQEQRTLLEAQRDELQTQISGFEIAAKTIDDELRFRINVRARRTELESAAEVSKRAKSVVEAAQPEKDKLSKLDQVEVLRIVRQTAVRLKDEKTNADSALQSSVDAYSEAVEAEKKAASDLELAKQADSEAESSYSKHVPLWSEAESLDSEIRGAAQEFERNQLELGRREAGLKEAQRLLDDCDSSLTTAEQGLGAVQRSLAEHAPSAILADRLPEILLAFEAREGLTADLAKLERQLEASNEARAGAVEAETSASASVGGVETDLEGMEASIHSLEIAIEASGEANLRSRERTIRAVQEHVRQAVDLNRSALLAQEEGKRAEGRAESAQQSVETATGDQQRIAAELAVLEGEKRASTRAELTISDSADQLRSELEDESPCPVCGSTEHPYAHGGADALMRAAEEIRLQRELVEKKIKAANKSLRELAAAIGSSNTSFEQAKVAARNASDTAAQKSDGYRKLAPNIVQQLELLSVDAFVPLEAGTGSEQSLSKLSVSVAQKLSEADSAISAIDKNKLALDELRKEQKGVQSRLRLAREQEKQKRTQREAADENYRRIDGQTQEKRFALSQQDATLLPHLALLGLDPALLLNTPEAAREKLEVAAHQVLDWRAEFGKLTIRVTELRPKKSGLLAGRDAAQKQLEEGKAEALARGATHGQLKQQRSQLLGGEQTQIHRQRFETARKNGQETRRLAQLTADSALQARNESLNRRNLASAALSSIEDRLKRTGGEFANGCQLIGLSLDEAASLLETPPVEREALRSRLGEIDRRLEQAAEAERLRRDDLTALGKPAEEVPTESEADNDLKQQQQAANESIRLSTEQLGSIRQQLEIDDSKQATATELLGQIQGQKEKLDAWAEVNQAVGSRSGDRFRIFAQSITLEHLVQLANRHLEMLGPRYRLAKGGEGNLALHIVDCDMEQERRSTRSLSGGERFLVSLALALALSGMNGRQSFVDTLFIDEGFGALDHDTLDIAIDALEVIQSLGRKIGIVTHVAGMKERLPVQVRVEKLGAGRSRVRLWPESSAASIAPGTL